MSEVKMTNTDSRDSLLVLDHVSKFYGTVIGVGDLNLNLPRGAYGLVGPNGSGKTTLINLMTGAFAPSIGTVKILGRNPAKQRDVLASIGLCPASDILYPNVSAFHWVSYLTELHGFSKSEAEDRAVKSLRELGMEANMMRPIGSYSLGMRQRTKLAQATAHDPELLILDEPFNGLDPIGRHDLSEFLGNWNASGKSLILASHILHEVEAITSSFLLIHGGRILASGDASEVRTMLRGFPVEVRLTGRGLDHLAGVLSQESWMMGLDFEDAGQTLVIRVGDKGAFYDRLRELACDEKIALNSIDSPDGSLESAFDLLLRVHRGELLEGGVQELAKAT
ncbi:MAG: ABC transporter ATP-binding protein [Planctomycetota bacterium]